MTIIAKPILLTLALMALLCGEAAAQQTTLIVGYPPGASYDIYARTFARHLGKHLPGTPTVVVQNMAGAGSLRSANFLYNAAPKDGSTIGVFARGLAMQPLLDNTGIQFDARKFNWLGSISSDVSMVLSWHTRPFKTIDDVRKNEMIVAGTGSGADSVIFPYILNGVLGTKFRVVTGYPGATAFLLAVERGEADGTAGVSWSSIAAGKPDWVSGKKINVIMQLGLQKHPDLGKAPLVMEFAKNDSDRGVLELIFARQEMAYPVVAPPGLPPERVETLRKAFDATLKDPGFRADAKKQSLDDNAVRGTDIASLLTRIYASPPDVVARARKAIVDGKNVTTKKR
ncbi:MAG: Bug family tripartite tricarboxylate transporter substrate binding protein [Xanthobacteraceae bacterium]